MKDIRKQIVGGQASFAQMARQYSEDGSGAKGGDLGWLRPAVVPKFEKALNALQPGEISEPVVSRFGGHLICSSTKEVQSPTSKARAAKSVLRERKFESTTKIGRASAAQAWVEMRDAP
ncbi:MAG: peptidylprolyl isomerase [Aquabacterium sp.]